MYSRPKPGETEEDLLRLQEEFLKKKAENAIKPAATLVSEKKETGETAVNNEETAKIDIEEQLANTFEAVPTDIKLGNVVEKKGDAKVSLFKFKGSTGFPKAKRRDVESAPDVGSIFSQQIKKQKMKDTSDDIKHTHVIVPPSLLVKGRLPGFKESQNTSTSENERIPSINEASCSSTVPEMHRSTVQEMMSKMPETGTQKDIIRLPDRSFVLQGADSPVIHQENVNILSNMSEGEILEERNRLLETLDPAILGYLKSRRQKEVVESRNPTIQEQNRPADSLRIEDIEVPANILRRPEAESWLNFDVVEANKLAWMENVDVPKLKEDGKYEARFDLEGWLLPFTQPEINESNRHLYHHGEEPGRPGYTLQELFQLARSSVVQQKVVALNCIANILSVQSTGAYNHVIDIPIEQVFFVVRICLDDNVPAVLNASIKAMRNLIYSQIDEVCMDGLLGFGLGVIQPILAIDDLEDDNTVNDQQLAETNLIKCLARTDILIRIRYILCTVRPAVETVVYCLEILVRLARDSQFIVKKIIGCDNLISSIIKFFVPKLHTPIYKNTCYDFPLQHAIKFLRILASRDKKYAELLINKYEIMDSIAIYVSNDKYSANAQGIRLQTESMHLWSVFVNYGLALDYFESLTPALVHLLTFHSRRTSVTYETSHVRNGSLAALLMLLSNVAHQNITLLLPFIDLIFDVCLEKWMKEFKLYFYKEFECGKLQIVSALLNLVASIRQVQPTPDKVYKGLDFHTRDLMSYSDIYTHITATLSNCSMLLNNYETYAPSANLRTVQAAAWNNSDHVVPIFQTNSSIPFLYNLARSIEISGDKMRIHQFITHKNIQSYISSLNYQVQFHLTGNWFTRIESLFIMSILKMAVRIQEDLPDSSHLYKLAVNCLCIFNAEQKPDIEYIFNNIIFCRKFYPCEVLMRHFYVDDRVKLTQENLSEILNVYSQVLGLKNNVPEFSSSLCLDIKIGTVIPVDWVYTPIMIMYANQQQNKSEVDEEELIYIIKNCLQWILIYESCFPSLITSISPTDRYCRLACIFLASDSVFLVPEIHHLLRGCFSNVMKHEKELNFNGEIQGLSNFHDLYTQLLDQYQAVSYGDILFGSFIMVPLGQRHLKQYKKTFWSEYLGIAQILNFDAGSILGTEVRDYVYPPEDDISLIKAYQAALVNGTVRPYSILHHIAKWHVKNFTERLQNEKD